MLAAHALWVANHLRWVATDQINPWRLGGYGMYTVPAPSVRLHLYVIDENYALVELDRRSFSLRRFNMTTRFTNIQRTFRCKHVGKDSLLAFYEENPPLRGRDAIFVFSELKFVRNPVSAKRAEQGRVTVTWQGRESFQYISDFCGNQASGTASLI